MKLEQYNLIAVVGATASGKTSLAVELAKGWQGEILSADSRQVYRGMDIGSGKDLNEYGDIPYHLIDIADPNEEYNLFRFQQDFYAAFTDVTTREMTPILCGGTFLYIDAILSGYEMIEVKPDGQFRDAVANKTTAELRKDLIAINPSPHNTTDTEDRERIIRALEINIANSQSNTQINKPDVNAIVMAIDWTRPDRTERIKNRLEQRLNEGMIEEVKQLHDKGVSWERLYQLGLEYRFIAQYIQGSLNFNDMYQKLASAIVKFAKRQDNWLRKLQRNDLNIHMLDPNQPLLAQANQIIKECESNQSES